MSPTTLLMIALVVGAVAGTFSRLWASPAYDVKSRQLIVEVIGNGVAAILIPYVGTVIPALDITKLPPVAAGAVMYFIASGSGDFLGNVRQKVSGMTGINLGGTTPPPAPPTPKP
jgi:hypothetical protein